MVKPVFWITSSLDDLRAFPEEVRQMMGYALWLAQRGEKHADAKPLKGFGGATILEIVEDHGGNTFRGIYTVKFPRAVYVLHAFQKKSKRGIQTPQQEVNLIRKRLKTAEEHYKKWQRRGNENEKSNSARKGKKE